MISNYNRMWRVTLYVELEKQKKEEKREREGEGEGEGERETSLSCTSPFFLSFVGDR